MRGCASAHHWWFATLLVLLASVVLGLSGIGHAGEMVVVPDEMAETPSVGKDQSEKPMQPALKADETGKPKPTPSQVEADSRTQALVLERDREIRALDAAAREETRLMMNAVQIIDRDTAAVWLASFISSKPWYCPPNRQQEWIEAILSGLERNQLPICKEILALVVSVLSIESGFRVDPQVVDPSSGEDIRSLLDRAEKELFKRFGPLMHIPPVPQLYARYKERYYPSLMSCRTEGDVEAVARRIADELKKDANNLPEFLRNVVNRELDKITTVVRTKGSMQLNFVRARQVMHERGEQFTDQELSDYMYTMAGGVDVGIAALKPMFVQYATYYAVPGDLSWLFFVGMDYHYGPFSSRNMMEQIRIRDLSAQAIPIDGDFLHYDEKGHPLDKDSETLKATSAIFPSVPRSEILRAFLLEKHQHYVYTELHRAIKSAHTEKFGETPFAVIGELWMGKNAQIKHGATWKTHAYLKKLDRYLNSVPWDR